MSIFTSLLQLYGLLPLAAIFWLGRPALLTRRLIPRLRPSLGTIAAFLAILAIDAAVLLRLSPFAPGPTLRIIAIDAAMLACLLAFVLRQGMTFVDLCVVFSLAGICLGLSMPGNL